MTGEVAGALVHLHREHFGRGPASARAYIGEDILVCVLIDVYTQVERTLIDLGKTEIVRETRLIYQRAVEDQYVQIVQRITGREVTGFASTVTFDPDPTCPLPNLGMIAGDRVAIGSVTIGVAAGGNGLFVGGGSTVADWYPQRPGNEIALGFEHLQATAAQPVYSMGFEMVEPNATVPPAGGTPVDDAYQVTAYAGDVVIWQGIVYPPDDVVSFVGFWSDQPFDRLVIDDVLNNPDDEYFGEFYTGTTPAPAAPTVTAAATGALVPGAIGTFASFPPAPAAGRAATAFQGISSTGAAGL